MERGKGMWRYSGLGDMWTRTGKRTEYRLQVLTVWPICTTHVLCMYCSFPKSPPWEKLGTESVLIIPTTAHESNYVIALCVFKSTCFENNYVVPLTSSLWF